MESKFTGGLGGLIGVTIVQMLMTMFTLGIMLPWAVCYKERWVARHTNIDGRQLEFVGKGGTLFGKYIVWMLLSIVTFGIYALWLGIKLKKWIVSNTHVAGQSAA